MKRTIIYFLGILTLTIGLTSCNNYVAKKPKLESEIDSLNYVVGLSYGDQVNYELFNSNYDEESIKSFFMGIQEGFKENFDASTIHPYISGVKIGVNAKTQEISGIFGDSSIAFNPQLLRQGAINALHKDESQMTIEEADNYLNAIFDKKQKSVLRAEQKRLEEEYKENKEFGEFFLQKNAQREGIVIAENGLQYEVLKEGEGAAPTENDIVRIHYRGFLLDGTEFDSSPDGEPVIFQVNNIIKGWKEALLMMPVGSKWRIYLPYDLAYGMYTPFEEIKPFSALIFEIELVEIVK